MRQLLIYYFVSDISDSYCDWAEYACVRACVRTCARVYVCVCASECVVVGLCCTDVIHFHVYFSRFKWRCVVVVLWCCAVLHVLYCEIIQWFVTNRCYVLPIMCSVTVFMWRPLLV